jgi:hypothetical protein
MHFDSQKTPLPRRFGRLLGRPEEPEPSGTGGSHVAEVLPRRKPPYRFEAATTLMQPLPEGVPSWRTFHTRENSIELVSRDTIAFCEAPARCGLWAPAECLAEAGAIASRHAFVRDCIWWHRISQPPHCAPSPCCRSPSLGSLPATPMRSLPCFEVYFG